MTSTGVDRIENLDPSVAIKAPVKVATVSNITLSAAQTIDGISIVEDDRVLVRAQTDSTENGIYVAKDTAWVRADDFNGTRDVVEGTTVIALGGSTTYGAKNTYWEITTSGTIVIGTSSITFAATNATLSRTPYNFDTIADALGSTEVASLLGTNNTVHVKEYATGKGIINASYDVVVFNAGTADGFEYLQDTIDGTKFQLKLRIPSGDLPIELWGVYGDNSTNNFTKLQAALDTNYPLNLSVGCVYLSNSELEITVRGKRIVCSGNGNDAQTAIIKAGAAIGSVLSIQAYWTVLDGFRVIGDSLSTYGIVYNNGNSGRMINCDVYGATSHGVFMDTEYDATAGNNNSIKLEHSHSRLNGGSGVYIQRDGTADDVNNIVLDHMECTQNTSHGLYTDGIGTVINAGLYESNTGYGIYLEPTDRGFTRTQHSLINPWVESNTAGQIYPGGVYQELDSKYTLNSALSCTTLNNGALAGCRNAIINGDFKINNVRSSATLGTDTRIFDVWNITHGGATGTISQADVDPDDYGGQRKAANINFSGAPSTTFELTQKIRGADTYNGQGVTFSCFSQAPTADVITLTITQNFGSGGSPSSSVSVSSNLSINGTSGGITGKLTFCNLLLASTTGKTFGTNEDDYLDVKLRLDSSSPTGNWYFTAMQLEPGWTFTPFEIRPRSIDLAAVEERALVMSVRRSASIEGLYTFPQTMWKTPASITASAGTPTAVSKHAFRLDAGSDADVTVTAEAPL